MTKPKNPQHNQQLTTDSPPDPRSQEDIPDMIQQILGIHQREIDRIQLLITPTQQDIKLSIQLMQALTSAYTNYRVLKSEIQDSVTRLTPEKIREKILALQSKN